MQRPDQTDDIFQAQSSAESDPQALIEWMELHQEEPDNADYTDVLACVLVERGYDDTAQKAFQNLKPARELTLESHQVALALAAQPIAGRCIESTSQPPQPFFV